MFNRRASLPSNIHWDRPIAVKLAADLTKAGFADISVKLPHNLVGMQNHEITFQEFLDRDRNYPSLIIVAKNAQTNELIKVLVVNIGSHTYFVDDTFPSGHSQPPQLFVQSPDPARLYSLFEFFYEYLRQHRAKNAPAYGIFTMLFNVFVFAEVFTYFVRHELVFQSMQENAVIFDALILILGLSLQYKFFSSPRGLYIKDRDNAIANYISMALKGELKDNPIANVVISIVTTVLTALVLRLLGLV